MDTPTARAAVVAIGHIQLTNSTVLTNDARIVMAGKRVQIALHTGDRDAKSQYRKARILLSQTFADGILNVDNALVAIGAAYNEVAK